MDLATCWHRILDAMRERIRPEDVDTWLGTAQLRSQIDDRVIIGVTNRYYCEWIADNYLPQLHEAAAVALGHPVVVQLVPADEVDDELALSASMGASGPLQSGHLHGHPSNGRAAGVNPEQTFDSFVVGQCNEFAHGAAKAVAERPSTAYNPLFIYGDTGLGKTHLMHAIGNHILATVPEARVVYVTSEDFANEMINCIQHKRMEDFREKYRRRATVLLLDDVQFLGGRERTMEEFFHTFNALITAGHQIVLTSDKEPKDIEKLEARLRTRFEGGLLADMQPPDKETLMAILRHKSESRGLDLSGEVVDAIAHGVQGSIRELEGILNQISALRNFYKDEITVAVLRNKLPKLFRGPATHVTVAGIIEVVARVHNLRSADITGARRTRTLTGPRHIAMYIARKHTNLSFPELGREFGNRDHSTIQHGFKTVQTGMATDPDLAYKIRLVEQQLHLRS